MQLRFIVRGIWHRAVTIRASSTATLFILFATAAGTAFVSTGSGACNRIVFRLRARRYNRLNGAWRLAKTGSKVSVLASTRLTASADSAAFAPAVLIR